MYTRRFHRLSVLMPLGIACLGLTLAVPARTQNAANNKTTKTHNRNLGTKGCLGKNSHNLSRKGQGDAMLSSDGDSISVLRGNTLYQFRADSLALISRKELPLIAGDEDNGSYSGIDNEQNLTGTQQYQTDLSALSKQNRDLQVRRQNDAVDVDFPTPDNGGLGARGNSGTLNHRTFGYRTASAAPKFPGNTDSGRAASNGQNDSSSRKAGLASIMARWHATATVTSGDYIYVLERNTLYQLRAADLTIVSERTLPFDDASSSAGRTLGGGNMDRSMRLAAGLQRSRSGQTQVARRIVGTIP